MPIQTSSQSVFVNVADTAAVTVVPGDTYNLLQQHAVIGWGTGTSPGIVAQGANTLNIAGDVFSREDYGIRSAAGNHLISITATGSIFGDRAIELLGSNNTINNAGDLTSGGNTTVFVNNGSNVLTNTGNIRSGAQSAVYLGGAGNTINNSGYIESGTLGYTINTSGSVVNTGTIRGAGAINFLTGTNSLTNGGSMIGGGGPYYAVSGSTGVDTVINNGTIQAPGVAAIFLDDNNDTYDGRGGTVIGGVFGGSGADTLRGGAFFDRLEGGTENDQINGGGAGDYIDGGAGYDLARYDFATSGVQARLDNAALNTGEAAGDTMYNFEGLVGSQHGDILVGNDLAQGNQIYGLGGNDTIRGNGGADILYGNAGADSIFTGAGTDTVWVQAADRIATQLDRVFDFTDGQDHLRFQGILPASATITDSQGGTLIQFNVTGGQFSVFLDGITKAASADQIFFV